LIIPSSLASREIRTSRQERLSLFERGWPMTRTPLSGAKALSVLLGFLVVWQVFFILASNLLSLMPAATAPSETAQRVAPRAAEPVRSLTRVTAWWAEVTGQLQGWALYAPHVPTQAAFVAIELRWDEDPCWPAETPREMLPSEIEPHTAAAYFRPFGTFRLPAYEANLSLPMWSYDREAAAQEAEIWRQRLADAVRKQWRPIEAYLRHRLRGYERDHPRSPPPQQVLLLVRLYRIPPPGQPPGDRDDPTQHAVARWRPGAACLSDFLPVESYDPVTGRFEPVRREGGSDHE
jgi:hypothetical protein